MNKARIPGSGCGRGSASIENRSRDGRLQPLNETCEMKNCPVAAGIGTGLQDSNRNSGDRDIRRTDGRQFSSQARQRPAESAAGRNVLPALHRPLLNRIPKTQTSP